ncbi:nucleotidyl transferase AbiEii/AbiGii toxin family protein [Hydrogenimonas thermophila]|uniref:Nucleotidyl transferase AbiEii toxin, Type IV TA system n=1 Tax=Hydrogenimonas thermophila TaxID=223786 RepID=A0A1I5KN38_9BACT|nr:nucleotidyl transferase AbiEii/AbiGii toxin family protein [Hydrogenimonas thermophila]SFO86524.1 Nucleotidyl transferase AbiEii toxin, Type IV TA system [Hydrogenimonas thermophila]
MINPQTNTLLKRFKEIPLFKEYRAILIGGTALAYHVGHRESFDLDICFPFADTLPTLDFLTQFENVIPIEFDQGIIDTAINEGGDIHEIMQRFIIDGVKVDFMINPSSNIYESEILQKDDALPYGSLHIASIESIFKLKSLLLLDRNKIRDLYDVVYLIKHKGFTGKNLIETIRYYRITYLPEDIVQLIQAKKEDPFDTEGVENPAIELVEYEVLKQTLLEELLKQLG